MSERKRTFSSGRSLSILSEPTLVDGTDRKSRRCAYRVPRRGFRISILWFCHRTPLRGAKGGYADDLFLLERAASTSRACCRNLRAWPE